MDRDLDALEGTPAFSHRRLWVSGRSEAVDRVLARHVPLLGSGD